MEQERLNSGTKKGLGRLIFTMGRPTPSQPCSSGDKQKAEMLRRGKAGDDGQAAAVVTAQKLDAEPAEAIGEQVHGQSLFRANGESQGAAEDHEQNQLIELSGMYGHLTMHGASHAVCRELYAEHAGGGLAVATAGEKTSQPSPSMGVAKKRQRNGQPIAQGQLEPVGSADHGGDPAEDARHGGHVAPRGIGGV